MPERRNSTRKHRPNLLVRGIQAAIDAEMAVVEMAGQFGLTTLGVLGEMTRMAFSEPAKPAKIAAQVIKRGDLEPVRREIAEPIQMRVREARAEVERAAA